MAGHGGVDRESSNRASRKVASALRPPLIYAGVVALLGVALASGGAYLIALGGSPYFLFAGAALLASGALLWRGDSLGAWLYVAVLVGTLIWAIADAGLDPLVVATRIGLLAVLGLWLLRPSVRRRLAWRSNLPKPRASLAAGCALAGIMIAVALAPAVPVPSLSNVMTKPLPAPAPPPPGVPADTGWTNIGHDISGNRYSPLTQITAANVSRLKLVWTYRTGDLPKERFSFENTPLQVGDKLYVCTPTRQVHALNAATGKLIWRFVPQPDDLRRLSSQNCRGLSYHFNQANVSSAQGVVPVAGNSGRPVQGECAKRILVSTLRGELWALDADTGKPCSGFGRGGAISLLEGFGPMQMRDMVNTSPGIVVGDAIILGHKVADNQKVRMPSGVIRSFDVHSGRLLWAWDMGRPERTGAPAPGETYTESTPNSWVAFSADPALSLIYVPTGNPSPDFFGAYRRPFDEKYGTSLVALDTRTGRPRWSFQMVHHDLWDLDLAAQPILADWPTPTGTRKAVVELSKQGGVFVLDRATGVPIVPVREVPAPKRGGVPDERYAPSQPMSAITLLPRTITESDMWGLTPIDELLCRIAFKRARYEGPYTRPGLDNAIFYPRGNGMTNWGGGVIDPVNQILVTGVNYMPGEGHLLTRRKGDTKVISTAEMGLVEMGGTPYRFTGGIFLSVTQMPCSRPPWGELVGIDMRTGKFAWRKRLGTGRESGPFGIRSQVPWAIGTPGVGGNIITAGGVSFIAAVLDRYLRAVDVRTGRELWRARLPAGGSATPMTYAVGKRQFVVIAAGGHSYAPTKEGDYVLAYALDDQR